MTPVGVEGQAATDVLGELARRRRRKPPSHATDRSHGCPRKCGQRGALEHNRPSRVRPPRQAVAVSCPG